VGVDTLGLVVRGCLKAIIHNATQRAWWVRVRYALILTQFPRVLVSETLPVCLYCYTCVVRVCTVYCWSETSRSVMLVKICTNSDSFLAFWFRRRCLSVCTVTLVLSECALCIAGVELHVP